MINFFNLDREYLYLKKKNILENIDLSLKKGQYLQTKNISSLEYDLIKYTKKKYCAAVNSCTDAIYFALKSIKNNNKNEVITTSYSWISSLSAILRCDLKPTLIDTKKNSHHICLEEIEKKINKKTLAIIYTPLFGDISQIKKILDIKKRYKIYLIIDCAQSFGSSYKKKDIAYYGDISCLSFDPTKNLSAPGSGGALLTNKKNIFAKFKSYRYHGLINKKIKYLGYNAQMSDLTSIMLKEKLKYFDRNNKKREYIHNYFVNSLEKLFPIITTPKLIKNSEKNSCHKFTIICKYKNFKKFLLKNIKTFQIKIHYPFTLNNTNLFKTNKRYKNSEDLSDKILSLPINPWLKKTELKKICKEILSLSKKFYNTEIFS